MKKILLLSLFILRCTFTFCQETTNDDQLSEKALAYAKSGDYKMAAELFLKKIDLGKATPTDYYNLGKVDYNLHDYKMADYMLTIFNQLKPDYINGYLWRARALSNLDQDSKLGKAKPIYEIILDKTNADTNKYKNERIESFYYLTYYYYITYNETKQKELGLKSMNYAEKVIVIDPNNDLAIKARKIIENLIKEIQR